MPRCRACLHHVTPQKRAETQPAPNTGVSTLLTDTVGFITDLPHDLVASFRATLEEVVAADLLLLVRCVTTVD